MKEKFDTMGKFLHSILFRYLLVFNLFGKYLYVVLNKNQIYVFDKYVEEAQLLI